MSPGNRDCRKGVLKEGCRLGCRLPSHTYSTHGVANWNPHLGFQRGNSLPLLTCSVLLHCRRTNGCTHDVSVPSGLGLGIRLAIDRRSKSCSSPIKLGPEELMQLIALLISRLYLPSPQWFSQHPQRAGPVSGPRLDWRDIQVTMLRPCLPGTGWEDSWQECHLGRSKLHPDKTIGLGEAVASMASAHLAESPGTSDKWGGLPACHQPQTQ